jgi:hypothetical protein
MRKPLLLTAILFATQIVASAAAAPIGSGGSITPAQDLQDRIRIRNGNVTAVDDTAKTFTCHWKTADTTYHITDKTIFWLDTEQVSWADLKVGVVVTVSAHEEGSDTVADKVVIKAARPK